MRRRLHLALRHEHLLCATLMVLLTGCRGQGSTQAGEAAPIEALRFPHIRHAQVACTECHPSAALGGPERRPGDQNHASCDREKCHRAAFREAPGELCGLCHEGIKSAEQGGSSPLLPYPPTSGTRAQAAAFSHQSHLNAPRMESLLGFHISCTDCHSIDLDASSIRSLQRVRHAACARCHAPEAAPTGTPSMTDCLGCHTGGALATSRDRDFITGDLHFDHRVHRHDRRGSLISCATCHERSITAPSEEIGKHATPTMRVCVDCHDDSTRVPQTKRMRRCETCHSTRSAGIGAIAPRSHMPATERPANHTQAFRRDHAADARADSTTCARCHTMLSGNRRDTCDECHQAMRPRDHVVTWREYDHGPEAVTEPDRCTTCHQVDFCVTCHKSRPRSHFPSMEFRMGGHGTQAVLNMRACVTCHEPSRDCSGAGCHRSEL